MNKMKKYLALFLLLTIALFSCSCGNQKLPPEEEAAVIETPAATEEPVVIERAAEPEAPVQEVQEPAAAEEAPAAVPASAGCTVEANGYTVTVESVQQATDYAGNPVIFVNCSFANNGGAEAAFGDIIDVTASQNGSRLVGDGPELILDYSVLMSTRQSIGSGQAITAVCPFATSDFGSPVDISVSICENSVARPVLGSGSCTMTIG